MGIPRLWQDLLPYAERVSFGASEYSQNSSETTTTTITNLIIDGPSLVYFAYNKIAIALSVGTPNDVAFLPSYNDINEAVCHILDDLEDQGISVPQIFFDGGLPKSKRGIRLSRMEKLRQELELYRTQHPRLPSPTPFPTKHLDFGKVLWDASVISTRKSGLSPPPFMVASVIEKLCSPTSKWAGRALVVPGESDGFCARAARESLHSTAILTTDSDLLIHDIGHGNVIAGLQFLEKASPKSLTDKSPRFQTLCLNPTVIASRLQVPSLLLLGFERFLDPGASTAVIQQRAADSSRRQSLERDFDVFAKEFKLPASTESGLKLDNLDPRTAELVVESDQSLEVYLTPLMEDPQRDCSWTYGTKLRRVAYSLLCEIRIDNHNASNFNPAEVIEYAKRGQRIAPTSQIEMTASAILLQAAELQALHAMYFPLEDCSNHRSNTFDFLPWYALASHFLYYEKISTYKQLPSFAEILQLFGLHQRSHQPLNACGVSWEQVHLFSNIQAVLYSFRMLWQITGFILNELDVEPALEDSSGSKSTTNAKETLRVAKILHKTLSNMPPIADLFFDLTLFRFKLSQSTVEQLNPTIVLLKRAFDPQGEDRQKDSMQAQHEANPGNLSPKLGAPSPAHKRRNQENQNQRRPLKNRFDLLLDEAS